jgi:hypothetical protein
MPCVLRRCKMERERPNEDGKSPSKRHKTGKGKERARTPPRPPSPEPEPEPLFDERTGASSSRYRPPPRAPKPEPTPAPKPEPTPAPKSKLTPAPDCALSCDHYMSVLPHLPMRWLMMMVCVSKSLAKLREHPQWYKIAFLCFAVSFPLTYDDYSELDLPTNAQVPDLMTLYRSYFSDMSTASSLFSQTGMNLLTFWVCQPIRLPTDSPMFNLPLNLDVLRHGGYFSSFYSRQRLIWFLRKIMDVEWRHMFRLMTPCRASRLDIRNYVRGCLQAILRCEFVIRIAGYFTVSVCANNSGAWVRTAMHNPELPSYSDSIVMDIPESEVIRLNELFERVLLHPDLQNIRLIFSRLDGERNGSDRVILHYLRRYSSYGIPHQLNWDERLRSLFTPFHYGFLSNLHFIQPQPDDVPSADSYNYDYRFLNDVHRLQHFSLKYQTVSQRFPGLLTLDDVWRRGMELCRQRPMWGAFGGGIQEYLGENWWNDVVAHFEAIESQERWDLKFQLWSFHLENAARATPPQSPGRGAAPDESDPRITPEDGE